MYTKEFKYRVKNDGIIFIKRDKIIKKKPKEKLTVDLMYDKHICAFLDMDKNIYRYHETKNELNKL